MQKGLAELVQRRAGFRCEYCRIHVDDSLLHFEFDHNIAEQHGGDTIEENLAYSCLNCNRFKGPNLSGVDPHSKQVVRLFDPRTEVWNEHFEWDGPVLLGRTPTGRATIQTLKINLSARVRLRRLLLEIHE